MGKQGAFYPADVDLRQVVVPRPHIPDEFDAVVIPIDKEPDWTSFDVVKKLKGMLRVRKVGHAGTLDPLATGLVVCLIGKATRLMERFMMQPKTYTGTIRLGETTPSYDAETKVNARSSIDGINQEMIEQVRESFLGDIEQLPPMYSAIRVEGERLYHKARRGEVIKRPPRQVHVSEFTMERRTEQDIDFVISCSRGTYIRSIAHDFGQKLGVGAYLKSLRRTQSGFIHVDHAWSLKELSEKISTQRGA